MKRMLFLIFMGLTAAGSALFGENLVQNGDFSMPVAGGGAVPHWEKAAAAAVMKEGNETFLRLKDGASMAQQFVPVPSGTKGFKLSLKVRPGDATAKRYEVLIAAADATKKMLGKDGNPANIGNTRNTLAHRMTTVSKKTWDKVELSGPVPEEAAYILVILFSLDKGTIDFAELELDGRASAPR